MLLIVAMARSRWIGSVCVIAVAVFLPACGGGKEATGTGGVGGSGGSGGLGGTGGSPESSVLAFARDPDGSAVSDALFSDSALTDSAGVAVGAVVESASGWATVSALGYLPGVSRSYGTLGGLALYETRLTPTSIAVSLDSLAYLELVTAEDDPRLSLTLDGAQLAASPAYVEAAFIERLDVEPRFQTLSVGSRLPLWGAFGLIASDSQGKRTSLLADETLEVRVRDDGQLSAGVQLATFDVDAGNWSILPDACVRDDAQHLACTIPTLDPLFGLFEAPETLGLDGLTSGVLGDEAFQQTGDAFGSAFTDWAEDHEGGSWNDLPDSLKEMLEDWANAALEIAAGNEPEAGKGYVLRVEAQATLLGAEELRAKLHAKAVELANLRAEQVLEQADCGMIRELLAAIEQLEAFGGDPGLEAELRDKIKELMEKCHTWFGEILVGMNLLPELSDTGVVKRSGATVWIERHKLIIQVNPESGEVGGQDTLTQNFPQALYDSDDAEECPASYQVTFQGSGGGMLGVEGSFDGQHFTATLVPGSSSFVMTRNDKVTGVEDEECVIAWQANIPFLQGWLGVIVQGIGSGGPPLTFQDLLDASDAATNNDGELVRLSGMKPNISLGVTEGLLPVEQGTISWRLSRPDAM